MPFTFKQAQAVCADHQYLVGGQINKGWRVVRTIEAVVISPFDNANKHLFIEGYKENRNGEKSLQFYDGGIYDVLVLSRSVISKSSLDATDLEKYLSEQRIPLEYNKYMEQDLLTHA